MAVSYTHLDVYKRQVYFLPNDQRGFIEKFPDMKVYDPHNKFNRKMKQYNIYSPNNWPFNYLRAKNAGASGFIGILHDFMDCHYFHEDYTDIVNAVSYTHLDVYKRQMYEWLEEVKAAKVKKAMPVLSFPAVQMMDIRVKELISDSDRQATGCLLYTSI